MHSFPYSNLMSRFQSQHTNQTTVYHPPPAAGNASTCFPNGNLKVQEGIWIAAAACIGFLIVFFVVRHFCNEYRRIRRRVHDRYRSSTAQEPTVNVADLPKIIYRGSGSDDADGKTAFRPVECVVCLSKVDEGEEVRILPNCSHLFHVECIDVWLEAHSTCPVCRSGAAPPLMAGDNRESIR